MRKPRLIACLAPLALAATLSACDGESAGGPISAPAPTPTPTPTPTATPTPTGFNVAPCLNQTIPGTGGVTVAGAVVPDTITVNLAAAPGFPNGRQLTDPVIDVTLAIIFLDLRTHSPTTFAAIPVNPAANDRPFSATFPFLAPPQGTPPLSFTTGTNFNFRTDPASAYVRVDRTGMPAVATALIDSARQEAYNDADPVNDAAGAFTNDLGARLTLLTNALADDLQGLGLTPCATPN